VVYFRGVSWLWLTFSESRGCCLLSASVLVVIEFWRESWLWLTFSESRGCCLLSASVLVVIDFRRAIDVENIWVGFYTNGSTH